MGIMQTKHCLRNKTLDNFIDKKSLFLDLVAVVFFIASEKAVTPWHTD